MIDVTFQGTLVADPEVTFTSSGVARAKMRIAMNDRYTDRNGQLQERPTVFMNAVAWRRTAENAGASLHKGDRVVIVGRLEQRDWETEDGQRRSVVEISARIVAADLSFATATVSRTPKEGGGYQPASHPAPASAPAAPAESILVGPTESDPF